METKTMQKHIIVFLFLLFQINLFANDYSEAKVMRESIDSHERPSIDAPKTQNAYKMGDVLYIEYCNKLQWCKTPKGYVKQYLLFFDKNPLMLKNEGVIETVDATPPFKTQESHWNQSLLFSRIAVDEDVKDLLRAIALQNNSQILFDKDIQGIENLTIENMPLEGAFNLIMQRNNLSHKWQGNTLVISSVDATTIKRELIVLQNLTIDKLITLLKRYKLYDRLKSKVIFDTQMNALFIEASGNEIADLQNILKQFEIAERLLRENRIKRTQEDLAYQKLESINQTQEALKKKKEKYGMDGHDEWKMLVDIIELKYINVKATEIEFLGQKIQVESLEDTLRGLLGTGYAKTNVLNNIDVNGTNTFASKEQSYEKPYLKIDGRTNSVIIKDYPDRIDEIKAIIARLDIPAKLIEIEVTIATGTTGFTNQLGLALGGTRKSSDTRTYGISTSSTVADNLNNPTNDLLQPSGAFGLSGSMLFTGSKSVINAQLNAMEEDGTGKVLSNPRIVTLNNREATIVSGNSVSIPVTTDNKIELETVDTGISIKATPHIVDKSADNEKDVMLDITIESSSLGDKVADQINKVTNKINTNVIMKNNETLILGGLFQYTESNTNAGVPLLKDIPILGFLFSTKDKLLNKNELVFFITPRIITSQMVSDMQNSTKQHYQDTLEANKKIFDTQMKQNIDTKEVTKTQVISKPSTENDPYASHEGRMQLLLGH